MKILSIDCSAGPASAAIIDDNKLLAANYMNIKTTHSQTLMPMIQNILKSTSTDINDIEGFAVSNGPGSFTGIRIGISVIKGLAMPRNTLCVGVSTLLSMAYNFIDSDCTICAVMDARCNQVYNAIFNIKDGEITRITEDRAILCEELSEEIKKMSQTDVKRVIIVGDGTDVFYPYVESLHNVKKSLPNNRYQNAISVGFSAVNVFSDEKAISPEALLPVYLRLPQAERELKKKKEVQI